MSLSTFASTTNGRSAANAWSHTEPTARAVGEGRPVEPEELGPLGVGHVGHRLRLRVGRLRRASRGSPTRRRRGRRWRARGRRTAGRPTSASTARRDQLVDPVHLHRAVADHRDHGAVGVRGLRRDRVGHRAAHREQRPRERPALAGAQREVPGVPGGGGAAVDGDAGRRRGAGRRAPGRRARGSARWCARGRAARSRTSQRRRSSARRGRASSALSRSRSSGSSPESVAAASPVRLTSVS